MLVNPTPEMTERLNYEPDPHSFELMQSIDRLSKPMRDLVREYGHMIVSAMIDDGYRNARELKPLLETWRERRQEQWLDTQYFTSRSARSIADAIAYRMADKAA